MAAVRVLGNQVDAAHSGPGSRSGTRSAKANSLYSSRIDADIRRAALRASRRRRIRAPHRVREPHEPGCGEGDGPTPRSRRARGHRRESRTHRPPVSDRGVSARRPRRARWSGRSNRAAWRRRAAAARFRRVLPFRGVSGTPPYCRSVRSYPDRCLHDRRRSDDAAVHERRGTADRDAGIAAAGRTGIDAASGGSAQVGRQGYGGRRSMAGYARASGHDTDRAGAGAPGRSGPDDSKRRTTSGHRHRRQPGTSPDGSHRSAASRV